MGVLKEVLNSSLNSNCLQFRRQETEGTQLIQGEVAHVLQGVLMYRIQVNQVELDGEAAWVRYTVLQYHTDKPVTVKQPLP